jgi:hypothetical protein
MDLCSFLLRACHNHRARNNRDLCEEMSGRKREKNMVVCVPLWNSGVRGRQYRRGHTGTTVHAEDPCYWRHCHGSFDLRRHLGCISEAPDLGLSSRRFGGMD